MIKNKFYLVSSELVTPYEPRICHVIKYVKNNSREHLALVKVKPIIKKNVYHLKEDVEFLIIASRFFDLPLEQIKEYPINVYILYIENLNPNLEDRIDDNILENLDWGELYFLEEEAMNANRSS